MEGGGLVAVRYPYMRSNVLSAVTIIAHARDENYWTSEKHFSSYFPGLCIEILYDLCDVFPRPIDAVGTVICANEVSAFNGLFVLYDPLVDDCEVNDGEGQTGDPRWPAAEAAARDVMGKMIENNHVNADFIWLLG